VPNGFQNYFTQKRDEADSIPSRRLMERSVSWLKGFTEWFLTPQSEREIKLKEVERRSYYGCASFDL